MEIELSLYNSWVGGFQWFHWFLVSLNICKQLALPPLTQQGSQLKNAWLFPCNILEHLWVSYAEFIPSNYKCSSATVNLYFMFYIRYGASQLDIQNSALLPGIKAILPFSMWPMIHPHPLNIYSYIHFRGTDRHPVLMHKSI